MKKKEKKEDKKALLGLLFLGISAIAVIGTSLAFFADYINGGATAKIGTFDLEIKSGTKTVKKYYNINGTETADTFADGDPINNLNPGDIIEIAFTAENKGNKSAWVREKVAVATTLRSGITTISAGSIKVYSDVSGTLTIADIRSGNAASIAKLIDTSDASGNIAETSISATPKIISGVGANAEADGTSETTNVKYYIYLTPNASNDFQKATVNLTFKLEGVQYRNNANPASINWTDAEALVTPFAITHD
jgi:hypothetical protein